MALKQTQQKKKNEMVQTQGPSMASDGNPPNPSDEIFAGRTLPIIPAQDVVIRRDFSIPIRPTLHYLDGLDGAAETVTSRATNYNMNPLDDHRPEKVEKGVNLGQDRNRYSKQPEEVYTENGVLIRGT